MPPALPLITLLTDFGTKDHFVSSMKGVILRIHPQLSIIDLSHDITAHRIDEAAHFMQSCYRCFPDGTVHLVVVDPGVGTCRRALVVQAGRQYFLAPDNGVLTSVLAEHPQAEIREIKDFQHRLQPQGSTFEGRDLFAPAAAWLAKGMVFESFGPPVDIPVRIPVHEPVWRGAQLVGEIVSVDRFGNLISNITRRHMEEARVVIGGRSLQIHISTYRVERLVGCYSEGDTGRPFALINSNGLVEIFVKEGSAASTMGVGRGQRVDLL